MYLLIRKENCISIIRSSYSKEEIWNYMELKILFFFFFTTRSFATGFILKWNDIKYTQSIISLKFRTKSISSEKWTRSEPFRFVCDEQQLEYSSFWKDAWADPGAGLSGHSPADAGVIHGSWITPSVRSREPLPDMPSHCPFFSSCCSGPCFGELVSHLLGFEMSTFSFITKRGMISG